MDFIYKHIQLYNYRQYRYSLWIPLGLICGGGIFVGGNVGHTPWCSPSLGIGGGLPHGTLTWCVCHGACGGSEGGRGGPPGCMFIESPIGFCSFPITYIYTYNEICSSAYRRHKNKYTRRNVRYTCIYACSFLIQAAFLT